MTVTHKTMANAIRALAMDSVQVAKSGHPGLPMGCADIATVLFTQVLKHDPSAPHWFDRDRFVLSAGHGSMLLYSLLYLTGSPDMTIDQLKHFRQLGSRTPGHPEIHHTEGVETTTGPLGQGIATAVGMALGERMLAAEFPEIVDHYTYVLASDGDLMEGISQEAIAIAGHYKLNKMIVLYDDNGISIDGPTSLSDSVDQVARFEAAGWNATRIDGQDQEAILRALRIAGRSERPSLIACRTTIGYGAPTKAGTKSAHGEALGDEEIAGARKKLEWPYPPFEVPAEILDAWRASGGAGKQAHAEWKQRLEKLEPAKRAEFQRRLDGVLPPALDEVLWNYKQKLAAEKPEMATRKSGETALKVFAPIIPELVTGSADLTGSNNTKVDATKEIKPSMYAGRYIHWGIREHGMIAACNGLGVHGGIIPSGASFMVFTDYCRPALRLGAMMGVHAVHVFTHDSIGLGEDGPTHQPVEHLASLRAIPNLQLFRPADAMETVECWEVALRTKKFTSILALSRQNLPALRLEATRDNPVARGAYEIRPAQGHAVVSIFSTGSEVSIAVDAQKLLNEAGVPTRVVSVPCMDIFDQQDEAYRHAVIGDAPIKVGVEAAIRMGWDHIIGSDGIFIGMSSFGASGPYKKVYEHFGITSKAVADAALKRHNVR